MAVGWWGPAGSGSPPRSRRDRSETRVPPDRCERRLEFAVHGVASLTQHAGTSPGVGLALARAPRTYRVDGGSAGGSADSSSRVAAIQRRTPPASAPPATLSASARRACASPGLPAWAPPRRPRRDRAAGRVRSLPAPPRPRPGRPGSARDGSCRGPGRGRPQRHRGHDRRHRAARDPRRTSPARTVVLPARPAHPTWPDPTCADPQARGHQHRSQLSITWESCRPARRRRAPGCCGEGGRRRAGPGDDPD